jgi:hypothetical protein
VLFMVSAAARSAVRVWAIAFARPIAASLALGTSSRPRAIRPPPGHPRHPGQPESDRGSRVRGAVPAHRPSTRRDHRGTAEIERLTAERQAYDRGNLIRGLATIGGAILMFIALIVILRDVLR